MKQKARLLTLCAALAVFAAPVLAQTKECSDEFKSAAYQKWYDNRKDHQDVAYQIDVEKSKVYRRFIEIEKSKQYSIMSAFRTGARASV